ncbi:hypothetical protein [Phenylobacterium sp.]|uniref:hypothetical protein n=1 Tax=Phenylobacterium sp. TaxID=1871053 RepID=UPI002731E761|nr:hypothetical protein [Phenylobacterium sp.]MDP2215352.1 hypothetical protein [Phenylobacterium sp.]
MDVVFTIVSRNYAAQAAVLMRSLARAEPDATRVVIAADGPIPELDAYARVIEAVDTGAPVGAMSVYYDALELNTAIKPHAFRRLLADPGVSSVTYLDPDIYVYGHLDLVREALNKAPLVVIPHLTRPLAGEANPNDHTILTSGAYNLGFLSARRTGEIFTLMDWWAEKCRFDCRVDFANGLFTDQKWMDLAPGLVSDVAILRDPGLDIAYWNLEGRTLAHGPQGWQVNGRPLGFFHFSGFDPRRPEVLSKHQDRIVVAPESPLARLLSDYAKALLDNGHDQASRIPYAYGAFPSGRPVSGPMRRCALRAARAGRRFDEGLSPATEAWMDQAEPLAALDGLPDVTREMDQVWREHPAAAARFARDGLEGRLAFHAWFAGPESLAHPQSRAAAQGLLEGWRAGARRPAPWPQADPPWTGAASAVNGWLSAATELPWPRTAAGMLAARADLRDRFGQGPREDLLAWLLGPEAEAGRFDSNLLDRATQLDLSQDIAPLLGAARFAQAHRGELSALRLQISAGYGVAVRARWPEALRQAVRGEGDRLVGSLTGPYPFPRVLLRIWDSRPDLQRLFGLHTPLGRLAYLRWLIGGGFREYDIEPEGLPQTLTRSLVFRLARLSVRGAHAPGRGTSLSRAAAVVVVHALTPAMADWPRGVLICEASSGRLRRPDGAPVGQTEVDMVIFATGPGFVAADAQALIAQDVSWSRAAGVWSAETLTGLDDDHPAWGFVDEVWSDQAASRPRPRPVEILSSHMPLLTQLAGLMTP